MGQQSSKSITATVEHAATEYTATNAPVWRKCTMNLGIVIGIIGILVSLVGIPIAFVVARRSRQLPDLRHAIEYDIILDPNDRLLDHGLAMTIGNRTINSISRSRVAFWNHRGDTVRGADMVESDPLRIQFAKDCDALQVRTLSISRPQTGFTATIDSTDEASVDLNFDFLDAGDGAIFEVIYQGTEKPTVLGTLRGTRIRNRGKVVLGPEALRAIAKSRLHRFFDGAPKLVILAFVTSIAVGLFLSFIAIEFGQYQGQRGQLVDINHYNLRTVAGQADFANVVQSVGSQSPTVIRIAAAIAAAFAVYFFISAARLFHGRTKQIIPRSVATLIATDNILGSATGDLVPSDDQTESSRSDKGNGR